MDFTQPYFEVQWALQALGGLLKGLPKAFEVFGMQPHLKLFKTGDGVGRVGAKQAVEMLGNKKCLCLGLPGPEAVLRGVHGCLKDGLLKGQLVGELVCLYVKLFVGKREGLGTFSVGIFKPVVKDRDHNACDVNR